MKYVLAVLLFVAPSYADEAAKAFATGLANGINQTVYGQQSTNNVVQQNVSIRQMPQPQAQVVPHYDARSNYGDLAGYFFGTYGQCKRFIAAKQGFADCEWVKE